MMIAINGTSAVDLYNNYKIKYNTHNINMNINNSMSMNMKLNYY